MMRGNKTPTGRAPRRGPARRAGTALAVLGLAVAACRHEAPRPAAAREEPARPVVTAAVEEGGGAGEAVPGLVQARRRASLAARIPASVLEVPFREGQPVPAGAVLVRLDDAALHAAVGAAEASLKAAEADLARMEALQRKGAATTREAEDASARAAGARAALSGARDNLAYAVLRAPFAGRLAAKRVNVGDVVTPGMPLVEVEGEGGLEVRATVSATQVALLRPGMDVAVEVDGVPGRLGARVSAVSPAGDAATHRFEVRADLPRAPALRSGLFARVLVTGEGGGEGVLLVPTRALFTRGGLTGVYVVQEGRAFLRWMAPGAARGDRTEARAGLAAGERVALDPGGLADGVSVRESAAGAR
jgi:RND family efflux transporter MFP subunit